jgi:hypothetical protein
LRKAKEVKAEADKIALAIHFEEQRERKEKLVEKL